MESIPDSNPSPENMVDLPMSNSNPESADFSRDSLETLSLPASSPHSHYLNTTIPSLLFTHNWLPTTPPEDMCMQISLRLFIFDAAGNLLLLSLPNSPNLTTPSKIYSGDFFSLPSEEETVQTSGEGEVEKHIAFLTLQMLDPLIRQERFVDLQFVDFAFEEPITEQNVDGFTLDVAVVLQVKGCTLDDGWVQQNMVPFDGHVLVDPESSVAKFLRCDVSGDLMRKVVERYNCFTADFVSWLDSQSLIALVLHTIDIKFYLHAALTRKQIRWAAIGQVERYPFEGLFIVELSKERFMDAAKAEYTHWQYGHWKYTICGSINCLQGGDVAQMWILDRMGLAQAFDDLGFLKVEFVKTPKKLRFEKQDGSRPLDRDDTGRIWSS